MLRSILWTRKTEWTLLGKAVMTKKEFRGLVIVREKKRSYKTMHTRRLEAWEKLHASFRLCYSASQAMQNGQLCMYCPRVAEYQDCSTLAFYCEDCCKLNHQICNIFHVPEKWVSDHYCSAPLSGIVIPLTHECSTMYRQRITVVSMKGQHHGIVVVFCGCKQPYLELSVDMISPFGC